MNYLDSPSCQIPDLNLLYLEHFGYIETGSFVEVGAFNGYNWSNTYGLAIANWNGLLVEPQPKYAEQCREFYRLYPNIQVEQCCVGDKKGQSRLYLGGSLSTTKLETVETYNSLDWSQSSGLRDSEYILVPQHTLDSLLEKYNWPVGFEVLVIDVEGAELDVLQGFSVERWMPKLCIVETHELYQDMRLSGKSKPISEYFEKVGYKKIYADYINSIFWVDK